MKNKKITTRSQNAKLVDKTMTFAEIMEKHPELAAALEKYGEYICNQTLATKLNLVDISEMKADQLVEIEPGLETLILVRKI